MAAAGAAPLLPVTAAEAAPSADRSGFPLLRDGTAVDESRGALVTSIDIAALTGGVSRQPQTSNMQYFVGARYTIATMLAMLPTLATNSV